MSNRTSAVRTALERLGLSSRKSRKGVRSAKRRTYACETLESRALLSASINLTVYPSGPNLGQSTVTLEAKVNETASSTTPNGSVTFRDVTTGANLGTVLAASGTSYGLSYAGSPSFAFGYTVYTLSTTDAAAARHTITATYNGSDYPIAAPVTAGPSSYITTVAGGTWRFR